MAEQDMTGAQRAAILLLGVGEDTATQIMRHMSAKEVQQVGEAMASITNLTNGDIEGVLQSFQQDAQEINPLSLLSLIHI